MNQVHVSNTILGNKCPHWVKITENAIQLGVKPLLLLHDSWDSNESCTMHPQQKNRVLANIAEKPCLRMCAEDWVGWIC